MEDCCAIPQRDCGCFSRPSLLSTTVKGKGRLAHNHHSEDQPRDTSNWLPAPDGPFRDILKTGPPLFKLLIDLPGGARFRTEFFT
jgi:hypothetical protein